MTTIKPEKPDLFKDIQTVRIKTICQCLQISRTQWWAGVNAGLYPKGVKLGKRMVVWKLKDIEALLENGVR